MDTGETENAKTNKQFRGSRKAIKANSRPLWAAVSGVSTLSGSLFIASVRMEPNRKGSHMSDGFTKLFSSIVTSSIWGEDDKTRIIWITMLALADADGYVAASIIGLANIARTSIEDTQKAIDKLASPDRYSRTKDHDGRRIIEAQGGYFILNYSVYRDRARIENRKEWKRQYMKKYMADVRQGESNIGLTTSNPMLLSSSSDSASEPYSNEFEQFWKCYPRKINKGNAYKAWKKAKGLPELQQLIGIVKAQATTKAWTKDNGQFIQHPATWLNARGWENDIASMNGTDTQPLTNFGKYGKLKHDGE